MIKLIAIIVVVLVIVAIHVAREPLPAPLTVKPLEPYDGYAPHLLRHALTPSMIEVSLPNGNGIGMVCFSAKLKKWAATWNMVPDEQDHERYIWASQNDAEHELLRREREHAARLVEQPATKRNVVDDRQGGSL